jgi:hypothetical protein
MIGGVVVAATLVVAVAAWALLAGSPEPAVEDPAVATAAAAPPASEPAALPRQAAAVTPGTAPKAAPALDAASAAAPRAPTAAGGERTGGATSPAAAAAARAGTSPGVRLVDARVCRELSTRSSPWRCAPPSTPADSGRLYFLTRVAASRDLRVVHRWYQGAQLRATIELPIRANPSNGYRTYSVHTVSAKGGTDWRVEARTVDGALLDEELIAVR